MLKRLFIFGAWMSLCAAIAGDTFYHLDADPGANYPKDKLYPHGQVMLYTGYSTLSVKEMQKNYFTVIGVGYNPYIKKMCDDALINNFPLIVPISPVINGDEIREVIAFNKPPIDVDKMVESVKTQAREAVAKYDKVIVGWLLNPEELRHWRPQEIEYLEKATAAIRSIDPQKRPITMYEPGHRDAAGLAKTGIFLDMTSKGMYVNHIKQKDSRIWVKYSTEQGVEARELLKKPDMLVIAIPEMWKDPALEEMPLVPNWARHDVYLSLISGARGVIVFSLAKRPKFTTHDAYFNSYAQVAKELNGELGLARVLMFGKAMNDLKYEIVSGPHELKLKYQYSEKVPAVEKTYSSLNTYEVLYTTGRYYFMVNSAKETLEVTVTGFPTDAKIVNLLDNQTITKDAEGKMIKLQFNHLEVKILKFTN